MSSTLVRHYLFHWKDVAESELQPNDFDELSRSLRYEMESPYKLSPYHDFSVFGLCNDGHRASQVGPIEPISQANADK